jgi:hypothetical protein
VNISKCETQFADRASVDHDMPKLAKEGGIVVGEALYRPTKKPPYFKTYIAVKKSALPHNVQILFRGYMQTYFDAKLIWFEPDIFVFEVHETSKSTLQTVFDQVQGIFGNMQVPK